MKIQIDIKHTQHNTIKITQKNHENNLSVTEKKRVVLVLLDIEQVSSMPLPNFYLLNINRKSRKYIPNVPRECMLTISSRFKVRMCVAYTSLGTFNI